MAANPFMGSPDENTPRATMPAGQAGTEMVETQLDLRNRMADLMLAIKNGRAGGLALLLYSLSFLYGMLHAAGPGHRKTIVFSLYLSREAKALEPLALGALLSLFHGGSAVLLILLFKSTAGPFLSRNINSSSLLMEGWAYTLLAILSLLLLIGAIRHSRHGHNNENGSSRKSFWAIGLTGFFPCPGAIMILIFTLARDMLSTGIFAVIAMSAGMALPISVAGYLAYFGKKGIFTVFKSREKMVHLLSSGMEILGFSLLFLLSFYMSFPFVKGYLL